MIFNLSSTYFQSHEVLAALCCVLKARGEEKSVRAEIHGKLRGLCGQFGKVAVLLHPAMLFRIQAKVTSQSIDLELETFEP